MASEDVGLADPHAVLLASACCQACNTIGLPECALALTECVAYLALAAKSNEVALAYHRVRELVRTGENPPVPLHIRNAPIESMEELGYGVGYQYGYNKNQTYLPKVYQGKRFMDVSRAVTDLREMSMEKRVKGSDSCDGCFVCLQSFACVVWSEVWHAEYSLRESVKSRIASLAYCFVHYLYDRSHGGSRDYRR